VSLRLNQRTGSIFSGCRRRRPQEQATPTEDLALPANAWDAQNLTWTQLQVLAARVLGELPAGETEIATANVASVVSDGTVE
jgi:hypothetical protein